MCETARSPLSDWEGARGRERHLPQELVSFPHGSIGSNMATAPQALESMARVATGPAFQRILQYILRGLSAVSGLRIVGAGF